MTKAVIDLCDKEIAAADALWPPYRIHVTTTIKINWKFKKTTRTSD